MCLVLFTMYSLFCYCLFSVLKNPFSLEFLQHKWYYEIYLFR